MSEELRRLDGLFVGQLEPEEIDLFEQAIERGMARRSYEGAAGFMGLAKVRIETVCIFILAFISGGFLGWAALSQGVI